MKRIDRPDRAAPAGRLVGRPARQRPVLRVDQADAVTGQGEVVGQFAAHQTGAHNGHMPWRAAQGGDKALVGLQVVDAPAQPGVQWRGQGGLGAVGQHQLLVAHRPGGGAQRAAGGADVQGAGVCHQTHAPVRCGLGAAVPHQCVTADLSRHGHRQQGFVVDIAGAGGDQGDRDLGQVCAQVFDQLPAGLAGADHHDAGLVTGRHRPAGRCLLQRLQVRRQVQAEVGLGHAAQRAGPVLWNVGKAGAGSQSAVGVALGFVVDETAGVADVALPGQGSAGAVGVRASGGGHAGISSALRRAISLRRCLMAGVTMATKCDSRTRRCTSEDSR